MSDFSRGLNRFVNEAVPRDFDARVRRIAMACYQRINEISPVDKGTFLANWNMAFGEIDRAFDGSLDINDVADKTSRVMAMIAGRQNLVGETIFISNAAPYAIPLENGYSNQAPAGVVAPVVRLIRAAIASGEL